MQIMSLYTKFSNYISKKRSLIYMVLIILLIILYGMQLINHLTSPISSGEVVYLTHVTLIEKGKLPYTDFAVWTTPAWLYLYEFSFKLFGNSLLTARLVGMMLGILNGYLLFYISKKISNRWAALLCIALVTFSYPTVKELSRIYYTSLAQFGILTGIALDLFLPRRKWAIFLTSIMFSIAVGSCQAYGLIIPVYLIYLFWREHDRRNILFGIAGFFFGAAIIGGYFAITDLDRTLWSIFSYSSELIVSRGFYDDSFLMFLLRTGKYILNFPAIWIGIIILTFYGLNAFIKKRSFRKVNSSTSDLLKYFYFLCSLLFISIAAPVFLIRNAPSPLHHIYYLPVASLILAVSFIGFVQTNKSAHWKKAIIIGAVSIFILISPIFSAYDFNDAVQKTFELDRSQILINAIKTASPVKQPKILTFSPYFALQAGGDIFPGVESGLVTLTPPDWTEEKAKYYHFYTKDMIIGWVVSEEPDLIVLSDYDYEKANGSYSPTGSAEMRIALVDAIAEHYQLVTVVENVNRLGDVEIYKRLSENE